MIKPILRDDIPESFETERLLIRVPHTGDGKAINQAFEESIERLKPWFPWGQRVPSEMEQEERVRKVYANFLVKEDIGLIFCDKHSGQFIGSSGLHVRDWNIPKFEIGYWIRDGYEGKGYVSEAVFGITRFAFEVVQAKKVIIRCDVRNTRSRSVAERVGYKLEGIFRNDDLMADSSEPVDMYYFGLTNKDYQQNLAFYQQYEFKF